eukprot:881690-Pelagomonas_calceolata.AAC.1
MAGGSGPNSPVCGFSGGDSDSSDDSDNEYGGYSKQVRTNKYCVNSDRAAKPKCSLKSSLELKDSPSAACSLAAARLLPAANTRCRVQTQPKCSLQSSRST